MWQRYLQPERLREAGVAHFDAWAAAFIAFETRVEVAPDGSGFRTARRPVGFHNVTEMHRMLSEVADFLPSHELPQQRPTPQRRTFVAQPGPKTVAYVAGLAERAEKIRSHAVTQDQDNMLAICGGGRKAALDPRLAGIDEPSPKLADAAREAARIYRAHSARDYGTSTPGALQLMLCDLGTPGPHGTSTYGRLRQLLIDNGVPASRIRFIHDARNDTERAALFTACRDGSDSVLIGSTPKVGIGTNIQTRLVAVHHVDAPWMPSDIEQREGRVLRPGNLNHDVEILTYVTEGTFDAYTWQTLARKAAFIALLFRSGEAVARRMEDISTSAMTYGEVLALATGNPHLLRRAELSGAIRRLQIERAAHIRNVRATQDQAAERRDQAEELRQWCDGAQVMADEASHMAAPDRESIADTVAAAVTYGRGSLQFGRARVIVAGDKRQPLHVQLHFGYPCIADTDIPRKGGPARVVSGIHRWLAAFIDTLSADIQRARHRVDELLAQAEQLHTAAASTSFGKQRELEDLMRQRLDLDAEIEAMADTVKAA